ncbi:MAG TPA: YHS domain-containing (seleno)protein [Gemmatimonadales bacterium]|jgi:YHS domain-containing protein
MRFARLVTGLLPVIVLIGCVGSVNPDAPRRLINVDQRGVALQGYDPVAYFTDNRPVKGDSAFASTYNGGTYFFVSADHKAMFDQSPARYEPQFGGYCGYAASINKVSPIGVEWFEILDGRLVLQHNEKARKLWHKDVPGNLVKADANWPDLVRRKGKPI